MSESLVHSGTLRKSPPEHKLMRTWQKRFFMLTSNKQLQYFKSEKDRRPVKDPIDLRSVTCIEASLQHKSFKHVFSINTRSRIYYLVADTQEEMEKWVEKLCEVCGFQKQSPRNSPDFLRNKKAATGQIPISKKASSMSPMSSPGSQSFSPQFASPTCPLSKTMPASKNRAISDPPEPRIQMVEYSGARKQSVPLVQSYKQYSSSPALGTDKFIQQEYNRAPPPRPVSATPNYDLVPPRRDFDHRYSDYDIPPPLVNGRNSCEVYDVVPPPKPDLGHSSYSDSDIYNDVPPPRPASDGDSYGIPSVATHRLSYGPQEVYDMVPPPRPASGDSDSWSKSESYDIVPAPRRSSQERLSPSDPQEMYDVVPSQKRAPNRLTSPRHRPTSQEMYDEVPPPRPSHKFHRQLSQEHYSLVPAPKCPVSSNMANGSLNSLFSSQCSVLSENTQGDRDSGLYDVPPGSSDYDIPPSRSDEDIYNVPPSHKDEIYDVPPSGRGDDIYDVPPGCQGNDIYDVPPGCQGNDIYDVPPGSQGNEIYDVPPGNHGNDIYDVPSSQTEIYDVPPSNNDIYNYPPSSSGPPEVNRSIKPPPVIDRSCKPKSGQIDHSYANMPPPVMRDLKPALEPGVLLHSYENFPGKKPRLRKADSMPVTPPRPPKPSNVGLAQSIQQETLLDTDYCQMVPLRSENTRCYSLTKKIVREETYEDMGAPPPELRRESGYSDSTSSSDHDDDNNTQYVNLETPQQLAGPPALPPGGLRNRKRNIEYAEVTVAGGQMNKAPAIPHRPGPNPNYTTIDVDLSRGLQQTRNEKAQGTVDS